MAKNISKSTHVEELDDDFDFMEDCADHDHTPGMMSEFIDANNNLTMMALELTKLVISKHSEAAMSEEQIFSTFRKATAVISENSPLRTILEKI